MITLPSATGKMAGIATYSQPFFTEYVQYIWLAIGILTAVLAVLWLKRIIVRGVSGLYYNKNSDGDYDPIQAKYDKTHAPDNSGRWVRGKDKWIYK